MTTPDDYTWRQIRGLGAKPSITSPEQYAKALERGISAAKSVANGFSSGPWLDTAQVGTLHWVAYKEIYPWAGKFRTIGLVRDDTHFSPPHLIRSDLRALNLAGREWFHTSDLQTNAREMAAYNAGFDKIHPFREGNAVVGRIIIAHQAREIYGREINLESDLAAYRVALAQANKGHFGPLAGQILEHSGLQRTAEVRAVEKMMRDATRQLKRSEQEMSQSW